MIERRLDRLRRFCMFAWGGGRGVGPCAGCGPHVALFLGFVDEARRRRSGNCRVCSSLHIYSRSGSAEHGGGGLTMSGDTGFRQVNNIRSVARSGFLALIPEAKNRKRRQRMPDRRVFSVGADVAERRRVRFPSPSVRWWSSTAGACGWGWSRGLLLYPPCWW